MPASKSAISTILSDINSEDIKNIMFIIISKITIFVYNSKHYERKKIDSFTGTPENA
jgi:hypothetical protein